MALQILGQLAPAGSANKTLFTSEGQCVCSSLVCCNRGAAEEGIRVAVISNGETIENKHFQFYDVKVPAKTTFTATLGITMSEGDYMVVYAKLGTISFSAYGQYL